MKFLPASVTQFGHHTLLRASKHSPTILVVTGVVGLGATAVMAAKATRKIEPVLDDHAKQRLDIEVENLPKKQHQRALLDLYTSTGWRLGKIYAPAAFVGTASAVSVLGGHRILVGRHVASMAAYSGLFAEFKAYRDRVRETFGVEQERAIQEGGTLKYVEDPDHKGEYKLQAVFPERVDQSYLRPWFEPPNFHCTPHPAANFAFLQGMQSYANVLLNTRGHVFLNEVLDLLDMPRVPHGQKLGWLSDKYGGIDGCIDFGFKESQNPHTQAFLDGKVNTVQLNFNVDGEIYEKI